MRRLPAVTLLILVAALAGCRRWPQRVVPGLAMEAPKQDNVSDVPPLRFQREGADITLNPRARYQVRAWAVETDRGHMDDWDFLMPMDLGLAWGDAASPAILNELSFHLKRRYLSYSWDRPLPIDKATLQMSMSNHHLIPSDEQVLKVLKRVHPGALVELSGWLVDVDVRGEGPLTRSFRTSLTREDVGSGACEILYVESAAIVR